MEELVLRFRRGSASAAEVQQAVEETLKEPDVAALPGAPDSVDAWEEGHGTDPLTILLVLKLMQMGGRVSSDVWNDVIWPRVRKRLGDDDAVGEPDDQPEDT